MPPALADALYALPPDVTKLPPELEQALRGMQGAILINCPGGSATGKPAAPVTAAAPAAAPTTALDAVNADGRGDGRDADRQPRDRRQAGADGADLYRQHSVRRGAERAGAQPAAHRVSRLGARSSSRISTSRSKSRWPALKTNWTGFWVLGLLSFLYGIFHAAGPGHGKVVISSYVLANEAQVRRGDAAELPRAR